MDKVLFIAALSLLLNILAIAKITELGTRVQRIEKDLGDIDD